MDHYVDACCELQLTACGWNIWTLLVHTQSIKSGDNTVVKLEHTIQVFSMKDEQSTLVIFKELNLQHGKGRNSALLCLAAPSANVLITCSGI